MSDFLKITGLGAGNSLPAPREPGQPAQKGEPTGPESPRAWEDRATLGAGKVQGAAKPGAAKATGPAEPAVKPESARGSRVEPPLPHREPAACIFQDEFPGAAFALPDGTSAVAKATGTSLTNGLWDWWCDSLNLGHSLKRLLGKTRGEVDGITGDYQKRAEQGATDISNQVREYRTGSDQSLADLKRTAKQLADSSHRELRETGKAALKLAQQVQPELERLPEPVQGLGHSQEESGKSIGRGAELIKTGISHIPAGGDQPLEQLQEGRGVLRAGLEASREGGQKHTPRILATLEEISSAADDFLAGHAKKPRGLSKEERARLDAVIGDAQKITRGAARIKKTTLSLQNHLDQDSGRVSADIDQSLNQVWNRIARDPDNVPLEFTCVHRATKDFVLATNDFRTVLGAARRGDARAAARLEEDWGFTPRNLPAEGTLFIDPVYCSKDVQKGQISAGQFPGKKATSTPPDLETQLFGGGRTLKLKDDSGGEIQIGSLPEYRAFLAQSRKVALGKEDLPADPLQVHLALRGGGGLGKRYPPAVAELYRLGVIPSSLSGTSAGSIAAAFIAAGADPGFFESIMKDERFSSLYDPKLGGGGLLKGEAAYKLIDEVLRDLTGIKDRPVTFADLKTPLHVVAVKYADSDPPAGHEDLGKWENRMFVFGPETTPNTPVALAVRASIAIPGVFEPVEMVDPTSGRTLLLADGGVLDNLPLGYNQDQLPTVAFNLGLQNRNHPDHILNHLPTRSIPKDQLYAGNPILNALYSGLLYAFSGRNSRDYQERFDPPAGTFVFNIPTWNIEKPSQGDTQLSFAYDPKIDPALDVQTHELTQGFFRNFFEDLTVPGAHGTNLKPLPEKPRFERSFEVKGIKWRARYEGTGDQVLLTDDSDKEYSLKIGKKNLESWILDDSAYGDLKGRLLEAVSAGRMKLLETPAPIKDDL